MHQQQHCMMLTILSMAPLHSLGQDDLNEVQYDFLGHVMQWQWHWNHVI